MKNAPRKSTYSRLKSLSKAPSHGPVKSKGAPSRQKSIYDHSKPVQSDSKKAVSGMTEATLDQATEAVPEKANWENPFAKREAEGSFGEKKRLSLRSGSRTMQSLSISSGHNPSIKAVRMVNTNGGHDSLIDRSRHMFFPQQHKRISA